MSNKLASSLSLFNVLLALETPLEDTIRIITLKKDTKVLRVSISIVFITLSLTKV